MAKATCSIDGCPNDARARGWCMKHYLRWFNHGDPEHVDYVRGDDLARFWSHVEKPDEPDACWLWTGSTTNGYGQMRGDHGHTAHRFAYITFVGPIPDGLTLDHDCHTRDLSCPGGECSHRRCVNPAHLVPTDRATNTAMGRREQSRRTHCPQGHPYDAVNTYVTKQGHRACRACNRDRAAARVRRQAASR